jgi:hypothetical protein
MTETDIDMKIDPARASALVSQLQGVNERITAVAKGRAVRSTSFALFLSTLKATTSMPPPAIML